MGPCTGIDRLLRMIPVGYMAKRMPQSDDWLEHMKGPLSSAVYSVGSSVNDDFADYVNYWKHNGWWFFDSPAAIQEVAREHSINLDDTLLFFYEVYEFEFHDGDWRSFSTGMSSGRHQVELSCLPKGSSRGMTSLHSGLKTHQPQNIRHFRATR